MSDDRNGSSAVLLLVSEAIPLLFIAWAQEKYSVFPLENQIMEEGRRPCEWKVAPPGCSNSAIVIFIHGKTLHSKNPRFGEALVD